MTVMSRPHGARVDRVREAANAVDACTGSVGRFLLRYPIARLFLFAYMVLFTLFSCHESQYDFFSAFRFFCTFGSSLLS